MEKNKILQILFIILACIPFLSIILLGLAIHFYPGGHLLDNFNEGFSFLYNTISDLGQLIAYNDIPNTISRILYRIILISLAFTGLTYNSIIWKFFQDRKATKWLSRIGSFFGITLAGLYVGLAFITDDTHPYAHLKMIYLAESVLFTTILIYDIVYFLKKDFSKLNTYSYLAIIIVSVLLMLTIAIAPRFGDELFHASRRGGHVIFTFIVTFVYGLQGIGAYLYVRKQTIDNLKTNIPIEQK
ncbi:MAG: hypothetical protein KGD59_10210 [Candidatus Heimdallarchaeota archaeon]|nr:hypothetical protein [Candidatus Heimdallarchaeota archaeon]MBY8994911.1 hypothetical protein [Candidatus Heimdallarchaeota archaeon]